MNNKKRKIPPDSKKRGAIDLYAAQCRECHKWRLIPTKEEYEEVRSTVSENPFICARKPNVSCDDPADIDCGPSHIWVIDKPNVPKTPEGFKRELILRTDFSKLDAYYISSAGKKLRCHSEVTEFIDKHPEYKHLKLEDFNFMVPKVDGDTIPENARMKLAQKSTSRRDSLYGTEGRKRIAKNE